MGRNSATRLPIYNRVCLWILKHSKYTIKDWMHKQSLFGHIVVLLFPLTLCVMSFVSLGDIGLFVFVYHFLNLIFKLIIAYYSDKGFNENLSQGNYKLKHDKSTPLYIKYFSLCIVVGIIALMTFFVFLPVLDFSASNLFSLVVGLSIVINSLDSIYSGIVSLYGATVEVD